MERKPLKSSCIRTAGYDPRFKILKLESQNIVVEKVEVEKPEE